MTPIRDSRGRVIGATKVARDITEKRRRQQQEDLRIQTERRLAAIVESSEDAILSCDLHRVIQTWNKGAERLFGYSPEDAIGKTIGILIPENRHDEGLGVVLERVGAGERVDRYTTVSRRIDGTLIETSLSMSPVRDLNGNVAAVSLIARDVAGRDRS